MDISVLRDSVLFKGFDENEVAALMTSLKAREKKFKKGVVIFCAGDVTDKLCFVTSGSVTVESNDMWGNRTILNLVGKGQFFAESYALLPDVPMLVDVCAAEDCSRVIDITFQIGYNIIATKLGIKQIFLTSLIGGRFANACYNFHRDRIKEDHYEYEKDTEDHGDSYRFADSCFVSRFWSLLAS